MSATRNQSSPTTYAPQFFHIRFARDEFRTGLDPDGGVAVAHNEQTRYKTYWAMVIAEKPSKKKEPKLVAERKTVERQASAGSSENPISTIKNFVCKYLC